MIRRNGPFLAIGALLAVAALFMAATAPPALPDYAAVKAGWRSSEATLLDRHGAVLDQIRLDHSIRRREWMTLDQVSPALEAALLKGEDQRFHRHEGVDYRAILGALRAKLEGRRLRGASTITMQLASMLAPELQPTGGRRGYLQKLRQMRAALEIERRWTKPQILEAYVNLLGYRGEVQGIDAASRLLLGKRATGLTAPEAAALAALLPGPNAEPDRIAARACRIAPESDCAEVRAAVAVMFDRRPDRTARVSLAPQLAVKLLTKPGERRRTTIDAGLQAFVTEQLAVHLTGLGDRGARDGAAIVVDNKTGEILAYVGSAGPNSRAFAVDGADAPRQAGSTLKPFLYALAIEKGYLTAASILDDSPVHLDTATGLYIPANYDRSFRGPVTVRTALAGSLNVPAVRTLLVAGVAPFRDRLVDLGYAHIVEDGDYYGFSLALGSAEVTLMEQVAAYRALARGGKGAPLTFTPGARAAGDTRIVDPRAAFIVADILADPMARAGSFGMENNLNLPFPASVKTGTSKAMRDNWCIGFTDRYTVGVWVGNFEGDSMAGVSGVYGAAPVWRATMLRLHQGQPGAALTAPDGVVRQEVAFEPRIETPRREWFLKGTDQGVFRVAAAAEQRPRILSPVNGSVLALDPDIPMANQLMQIRSSGEGNALRLTLDGHDLGPAARRPLWRPVPGWHKLSLHDGDTVIDRVAFQVR